MKAARLLSATLVSTLLLLPFANGGARAAVDEAAERMVGATAPLLRWENIEGGPLWAGGAAPRHDRARGLHLVALEPGGTTRLWLPAGTVLRLRAPDGRLAPADVALTLSRGGGVSVEAIPTSSADGRDLLIRVPPTWPAVVTVSRPEGASGPLPLAIFTARLVPPPDPVAYRDRLDLPGPDQGLSRDRRWDTRPFDRLEPGASQEVEVDGPARLMLDTRLPYDEGPPAWIRTYRIGAALDGAPLQSLEFETSPDQSQPVRVEGSDQAVGARQRGYLDIPAGRHRLSLESDRPVLVRVMAHTGRDWLFPGLNAPVSAAVEQAAAGPKRDGGGIWAVEEADIRRALGPEPSSAADAERLARRLGRDARWNAGLAGVALLESAAHRVPSVPDAMQAAVRLRGAATFWRDLTPVQAAPSGVVAQEMGWVAPPLLLDPLLPLPRRVPPGLPPDVLLSVLGRALFVAPSVPARTPLSFPVPEREAPSALRLLAERAGLSAPAELMLQIGRLPPRRIIVHPSPELPPEAYAEAPGAAGLARLPGQGQGGPEGTRSGAFSQTRPPGPLLDAGVVEIPLPRDAQTVRVWAASPGPAPRIALQYRASRQASLDDETYPDALRSLGRTRALALFARALSDATGCEAWLEDPARCPAEREIAAAGPVARTLHNEWIPLLRLLRARHRAEFATVAAHPDLTPPRGTGATGGFVAEARAREGRGDWIGALEAWTMAAESIGDAAPWWQAQLGRAAALLRLGEPYLAEQLLKALHRAPGAPLAVRGEVFERLSRLALETGDPAALLGPIAAQIAAVRQTDTALLARLAEALAAAGRDRMSAQVGLLLPPAQASTSLPQAAHRAGWTDVFARAVAEEPDLARRGIWLGLAAQRRGDEAAALAHFRAAGAEGGPWAAALERGQAIRARLGPGGAATPEVAREWGAWWAAHPGPRLWEDAEPLVAAHAGGATLDALGRDLPFRAWRAEPNRPVRLEVAGPAMLRVEARPVHRASNAAPLDGWVSIAVDGGRRVEVPVTRNQPSTGLALVGGGAVPGTAVSESVTVPAGRHAVTITPRGFAALVRASIGHPALPLSVLPPPQPSLVPAAAGGGKAAIVSVPREAAGSESGPSSSGGVAFDEAAALRHRMGELIRRFESRPEGEPAALVEAARFAHENPSTLGLAGLWGRLAQQSRWERFTALDSSAGYRAVPVPGWRPEAPALRARSALLPRLGAEEQLLASGGDLALSFINTAPTLVEARLAMADLPGTAPALITVRARVDEGPLQTVRLTPQQPSATLRIPVPEGEHGLRLSIADPQSNRFVRVRLAEPSSSASVRPAAREPERAYDVATAEEPVVLTLEGPAWLRVDELGSDGAVISRYQHVAAGWQSLRLRPPPGRSEMALRIFRLLPDRGAPVPAPPPLPTAEAAPGPPITVPDQTGPRAIAIDDRLPLGGQEDGTWSLAASVERTLPPDEDPGSSRSALYTQLRATWRHLDAANRLNWRGEVLFRPYFDREAPVIGLRGRVEHPLAFAPLTLFASASAFGQPLESHGLAWSGTVAGGATWENEINEKTYQAATVTGFARTLSLSAAEARLSRPDPDVFTRYKDQHRHGLRLSYALRHQPWLDTIWSGSVSLATNESLNPFKPDHISLSADWLQLLGPMVVDVGVTHTRFLEDADRPSARNDTLLRFGLVREWWMPSGRRWEIGAALGYRTLAREWVGVLFLAWHFGNGRGFRDFAPGEAPFADLRARPLFGLPNNGMRDAATH